MADTEGEGAEAAYHRCKRKRWMERGEERTRMNWVTKASGCGLASDLDF